MRIVRLDRSFNISKQFLLKNCLGISTLAKVSYRFGKVPILICKQARLERMTVDCSYIFTHKVKIRNQFANFHITCKFDLWAMQGFISNMNYC